MAAGTDRTRGSSRRGLLYASGGYALVMLVRLVLSLAFSEAGCGYGEIPIVTHWVLAGYLALLAVAPTATGTRP